MRMEGEISSSDTIGSPGKYQKWLARFSVILKSELVTKPDPGQLTIKKTNCVYFY